MVTGNSLTSPRMPQIAAPLLAQLCKFIDSNLGLHFPTKRWTELERGIQAASPDLGFDDVG